MNGADVTPGPNDSRTNHSTLIAQPVSIPAWNASNELWQGTVTCLHEVFAPYNVEITETDPSPASHVEVVFGGSPALLGRSATSLGVSPRSTTCSAIENSMVFVFTDVIIPDAIAMCGIASQEAGHSYGLDHELVPADPMSYLPYTGIRKFQDTLAECGEDVPRPCGVVGYPRCSDTQNSHAMLIDRLGLAGDGDHIKPTVNIVSPLPGEHLYPGFEVSAIISDNTSIKFATLTIDGVRSDALIAGPWTFRTSEQLESGTHVVEIKATDGANEAVASVNVVVDDSVGCSIGGQPDGLSTLLFLLVLLRFQRRT